MVVGQKNPWSYGSKTWYAYTTSVWEKHGLGPTWPPFFLSLFMTKNAKRQKWYFDQTGATDLIHGIHTQIDLGCNMGRIPPGYTSFPLVCEVENCHKKGLNSDTWTKGVRSMNTL